MKRNRRRIAGLVMISLLAAMMTGCSGTASKETSTSATPAAESKAEQDSVGETTAAGSAETAWPEKAVTIIVPYNAGGDSDFNARALAEKLTERTGQSFIVQNVAGNSGAVGSLQALGADPDGYTILFNHTAFIINHHSKNSKLTYDDATLAGVCGFLGGDLIAARPELGMTKLSEIIAYTKDHPGELLYGGSAGTTVLVAGLQLQAAGADITLVDTGGAADRLSAILGGHVDLVTLPIGNARDYLETGELVKIENDLGMEIGCPVYYQMMFPKGVDEAIVTKLDGLLKDIILNDADYAESIKNAYEQEPFYKGPEDGKELVDQLWEEYSTLNWN